MSQVEGRIEFSPYCSCWQNKLHNMWICKVMGSQSNACKRSNIQTIRTTAHSSAMYVPTAMIDTEFEAGRWEWDGGELKIKEEILSQGS